MEQPRTDKPLNGPERKTMWPLLIVVTVLVVVALIYLLPIFG